MTTRSFFGSDMPFLARSNVANEPRLARLAILWRVGSIRCSASSSHDDDQHIHFCEAPFPVQNRSNSTTWDVVSNRLTTNACPLSTQFALKLM